MKLELFTSEKRTTINWANGTSTELFIHPNDGNFVDRNFIFRISTATVEAEETSFTYFEGITRHLMLLKGEMELTHEGHYTKQMIPFEQDTFSGEWNTKSRGKVTDFNLMLKKGASGSIKHLEVKENETVQIQLDSEFSFIYCVEGEFSCKNGELFSNTDLIKIESSTQDFLQLHCNKHSHLIQVTIDLSRVG